MQADTLQRDAAVLIEAGREPTALRLLQDANRLRGEPTLDGLRLQAEARLHSGDAAVALRELDGARHPATNADAIRSLRAHLVLADADSDATARASALSTLGQMATVDAGKQPLPDQLRAQLWSAQARCLDAPEAAQAGFDSLAATLAEIQPQGGVLSRQLGVAREACPSLPTTEPAAGHASPP